MVVRGMMPRAPGPEGSSLDPDAGESTPSTTENEVADKGQDAGSASVDETKAVSTSALTVVGVDLERIVPAMAQLADAADRFHERSAHRESVIDALHAEVALLRRGERQQLVRPLLTAIARLRDGLLKQADTLPAAFDAVRAARLLQSFADDIELVLADNGISVESPAIGARFDPRRHRVASTEETEDESLVGTIARVHRAAYIDDLSDRLLAPASVTVLTFAKAIAIPEVPPAPGQTAPTGPTGDGG